MPNRLDLLNLVEAALAAEQFAYARQAALRYLADWPGDLELQLALARAYAAEGNAALAVGVLETLTAGDPEDFNAQRLLGQQLLKLKREEAAALAFANAHVADGAGIAARGPQALSLPRWAVAIRAAHLAERTGDWETARREAESSLQIEAPLPSLVYVCSLWHAGQLDLTRPLAEGFHARWPRVVAFKLCLAECLLVVGDHGDAPARAIELLHEAATHDVGGQVVARHWGVNHPYRSLWEPNPSAPLPGPMPAALVGALGKNQLRGKSQTLASKSQATSSPHSFSASGLLNPRAAEELADIQSQLNTLSLKLSTKKPSDLRPPTSNLYLLLSSRTRLVQAYGLGGFAEIDAGMKALAANAAPLTGLKSCVLYVDDSASLSPFGLRPVNPANAWEVKTLLGKLAGRLKTQGQAIGALLIVGGGEIIPFHHLPNPTDDADPDIPSDNPYATPDENYFVPEWPVGRMPSGAGSSPEPLLHALRLAAQGHARKFARPPYGWLQRLRQWLLSWRLSNTRKPSLGYVANVWKEASAAVYTTIGDPRDLLTCPPVDASWFPVKELAPSHISYFNLHGIEDGSEWYGQRSANDFGSTPEYPVALRPADVLNSGRAPVIVFSEACYGANILGKKIGEALCLRFLECGTRALVGSTKIAYGSVTTPLIGADLLGRLFWQNANAGLPVGEALRRAKLQMAQEMHDRQGFLDGEDQKTLISFVLYGDPLATMPGVRSTKEAKRLPAPRFVEPPATVCDKANGDRAVSPEVVAQIKTVVARYLPGMNDAEWRVAHSHARCTAQHACPTAHLAVRAKYASSLHHDPHTTVVTLSKTLRADARTHPHYARITLDEKGAIIKLAVSR